MRLRSLSFIPLAVLLFAVSCAAGEGTKAPGPPHVILFIGDGMGYSSELLASRYLYGSDSGLPWRSFPLLAWATTWDVTTYDAHALADGEPPYDEAGADPRLGYDSGAYGAEPWPLSSPESAGELGYLVGAVTDSASSATAMATGRKTNAGRIAWSRNLSDSAGAPLETIAELMRLRLGSQVGIVTTVPFDHATPAAFAAHALTRSSYADIAAQMILSSRPDVVVGGGHPDWNATYLSTSELGSLRASASWDLVERRAGFNGGDAFDLAAASGGGGKGLFGLFGGADGAMEAPVPLGAAGADGAPAFSRETENPSLARIAVAAARRMASAPGGFFLMAEQGDVDWANHANDLPRMLGAMSSLDEAVRAVMAWVEEPGDGVDWGNTLLIVTADHATGLPRFDISASFARGELPTVAYSTTGHGNELVTVAAMGDRAHEVLDPYVGARRPGSRILDNTDLYRAMGAFAGL